MAIITEPMALDKSFNTTETTPRSQADVLAGIEQAILHGMGRQANEVAYDNTTSGLSADDVQDAVDELAAEKVDKVTGKGLSTNDYTTDEKNKLAGIAAGAEVNVQSDWAQTDSDADDFIKNKQLVIEPIDELQNDVKGTQTVSGNPITLTDCAPINAESLVVELEPKQEGSGDPSPTNIRPITGYTECEVDDVGFNQWDEEWEVGVLSADGSIDSSQSSRRTTSLIKIKPNTAYYQTCPNSVLQGRYAYYDASGNLLEYNGDGFGSRAFTTPQGAYGLRITFGSSYGTTYNHDISINYPSTDHDYHPYHSSNATIQFGQTVYGGSVDFLTGVLTVDRVSADLETFTWNGSSGSYYSTSIYGIAKTYPNGVPNKVIFEKYQSKPSKAGGVYPNEPNVVSLNANGYLYTAADVSPTGQCIYELATPQIIQLTSQELKLLKGINHITTNGTTITIGYQPDNVIGEVKGEIEDVTPISGTATVTLLHEEDQGEDWIVGFTGEINGHFDIDHFDYYLTARYSHAYNTNTQILNMNNCTDGDYVNIWQTGTVFDFGVDGGVTVDISVTATKLTFTVNCIGDSIFGIYSSSETTGTVKYLITPARKG